MKGEAQHVNYTDVTMKETKRMNNKWREGGREGKRGDCGGASSSFSKHLTSVPLALL